MFSTARIREKFVAGLQRGTRKRSSIRHPESGQTLLEIALLLPMLVLLALGVVEFGRYGYIGILVANAARAGTAYDRKLPSIRGHHGHYERCEERFQK